MPNVGRWRQQHRRGSLFRPSLDSGQRARELCLRDAATPSIRRPAATRPGSSATHCPCPGHAKPPPPAAAAARRSLRPHLPPVGATHPAARRPFCSRRSRYAASPFAADAPRHHSSRRSRMRLPPLPSTATVGAILPSACASTRQHPVRPPVPPPRSSPPPPRPTPPHPPFFPLASTPSLSPLSLSSLPVLLGGLPPSCLSSPPPPLRRRYGRWNDGCLCALRTAGR